MSDAFVSLVNKHYLNAAEHHEELDRLVRAMRNDAAHMTHAVKFLAPAVDVPWLTVWKANSLTLVVRHDGERIRVWIDSFLGWNTFVEVEPYAFMMAPYAIVVAQAFESLINTWAERHNNPPRMTFTARVSHSNPNF